MLLKCSSQSVWYNNIKNINKEKHRDKIKIKTKKAKVR